MFGIATKTTPFKPVSAVLHNCLLLLSCNYRAGAELCGNHIQLSFMYRNLCVYFIPPAFFVFPWYLKFLPPLFC